MHMYLSEHLTSFTFDTLAFQKAETGNFEKVKFKKIWKLTFVCLPFKKGNEWSES